MTVPMSVKDTVRTELQACPRFLAGCPAGWRDHILWRRSTGAAWWTHFTLSACRTPRRWRTQTIKMCIWDPGERPGVGRQIWELFAHVALKLREDGIRREVGQGQISEKLSVILRGKQRKKNPKSNWERMLRRRTGRKRTCNIKNQ